MAGSVSLDISLLAPGCYLKEFSILYQLLKMDKNRILELLRNTTNPDAGVREPAEQNLNSIYKIIGFCPTLLDIVLDTNVEIHIRQAAVIHLKGNVMKYWDGQQNSHHHESNGQPDPTQFIIHEQDKKIISDSVVDAIARCGQDRLAIHLSSIVNLIMKADFPHKCSGIVSKVHYYLSQTNDPNAWNGALMTFYQLAKIYEFKSLTEREPFLEALTILLPISCQRLTQLIQNDPLGEQSCRLQKQILKTFHAILQFSLPLAILTRETFQQWMTLIIEVAKRDVPEVAQKDVDVEERPRLIWWKCKKWSLHLMARIFERYGSPNNVSKDYKAFAEWYISTFSFPVIQTIIKILEQYALGQYVSPRVLQQSLNYLNTAVLHSMTWKMLKADMMVVVEKIIFPLMCYSNEDEELWQNDPCEYIRMKFDIFEEYISPVSASQNLLQSLCKKRRDMIQKTMTLVINVLNNPQAEAKAKDGALHMIGSISGVLLKKPQFKDQMEQLLVTYVLPLFQCAHGFLRARACWVLTYFAAIQFQDHNIMAATQSVLNCTLVDPDLPVKVEAALCLQKLINCQDKARDMIQPNVKQLTLELVSLIRTTKNEDVMEVLQKIVYLYTDELTTIAVELTNHLAETFHMLIQSSDVEDDEKVSAAMAVLGTIDTVLTMMDEQKEVATKLEPIVVNVVMTIFNQSISELYEDATTILSTITADAVSLEAWKCFHPLYLVFKRDGGDYFSDMMSPIHNYITVDPNTFISSRNNLGLIFDMCQSIMTDPNGNEEIESYAAKLLEIVILQFRNQIDDCIPSFVELAITRLRRDIETAELRTLLLQIVIAALYSNYQLLFSIFEKLEQQSNQQQYTLFDQFLKQWMNDIKELSGIHDRKMSIIGFCTLILLPADKRPPSLTGIANQIVPSILTLCERLKVAYKMKASSDSDSDTDDDDEGDDYYDSDNEVEVLEDDQDHVASHNQPADDGDDDEFEDIADETDGLSDDNDYDDFGSENDCELTALETFDSLIDIDKGFVDEFILFKNTMESIRQTNPEWYQALISPLDAAQQKRLVEIGEYINERQIEAQKAATAALNAAITAPNTK